MLFEQMSTAVNDVMEKIHSLPFNLELSTGKLPSNTFLFYLQQDALYLADYSRALAMTASRMPQRHLIAQFIQFSHGALIAERDLHESYFQRYKVANTANQSPACFMYTNYLLKMASSANIEEAAASLLPCFWVYRETGKIIAANAVKTNHPYADWIKLYTSDIFDSSVQAAIASVEELGLTASATCKIK